MQVENQIIKPTSSPTPIRREVKVALIEYIMDPANDLPNDLNLIIEILYRRSENKPTDHLHTRTMPNVWNLLSKEATIWAGLCRRDPYTDVPKYPATSIMGDIRYTLSMVTFSHAALYDKMGNRVSKEKFRSNLAEIIGAMPDLEETQQKAQGQPNEATVFS